MIYNNLNRVKGILSARQGTEIPKFDVGGKTYTKQLSSGTIYSQDGQNWFIDDKFQTHYTDTSSMEFLLAAQQEIIPEESSVIGPSIDLNNNTVTIPGKNLDEGNPTAAVEAAAAQNTETEQTQQTEKVKRWVTNQKLLEQGILKQRNSLNKNGLTDNQQARVDRISQTNQKRAARVNARLQDRNTLTNEEFEQTVSTGSEILGGAIQSLGNAFGAQQATTDSELTKGITAGWDAAATTASQFGPIGQAVGSIMNIAKATGDIVQGITGGTDQISKTDQWMASPLLSWNVGIINDIWGEKSNAFGADQSILAQVGSSYGGTTSDIQKAASEADKKFGLFSKKDRLKANAASAAAASKQNIMGDIADTARDQRLMVQSMGEQAGLAYSMMTDGGYSQKYTYAAKHGGLLEWNPAIELEWEPQVELNWELPTFKKGGSVEFVEELEWIPEFKEGGKTEESDVPETEETTQKNVIPEGALHKNKHHMEHAEGLTKKGIPVVDEDGEQQAEIEHSEIIFTLEVTKKLEEYYEIFYSEESTNKEKEQAALDAGKLLVYQILENTEDRTGLIESCKKGGTLTFKKDTEELIEEVLEWMPTVVIIETEELEEKKEDKLEAKKEQSEKDKMKEAIREVLIELLVK